VLDPVKHKATQVRMPVRDPNTPSSKTNAMTPSPYWGLSRSGQPDEHAQPDVRREGAGLVHFARAAAANPDVCKKGSDHPSAKLFRSSRPTGISPCTIRRRGRSPSSARASPPIIWCSRKMPHRCGRARPAEAGSSAWLNRKLFEETGDEMRSQGWDALVLDTNGNGKRDDYVEPDQPVDPTKDKRIVAAFYGIAVNPADGTIWGSVLGFPGYVIRVNPGPDPAATALAEVFEPPLPGYGPRGMDIDRNGVVWTPLSSGHLASFDRRRCKGPLNGPTATAGTVPRAGRFIRSLVRSSRASRSRAAPRRATTPGSTSTIRSGWQERADGLPAMQRVAHRARERRLRQPARPVSMGFYASGWMGASTIQCRLEGQGTVVDLRDENAVPRRGRQGDDEQGREVPASPRSAGAMRDRKRTSSSCIDRSNGDER